MALEESLGLYGIVVGGEDGDAAGQDFPAAAFGAVRHREAEGAHPPGDLDDDALPDQVQFRHVLSLPGRDVEPGVIKRL